MLIIHSHYIDRVEEPETLPKVLFKPCLGEVVFAWLVTLDYADNCIEDWPSQNNRQTKAFYNREHLTWAAQGETFDGLYHHCINSTKSTYVGEDWLWAVENCFK